MDREVTCFNVIRIPFWRQEINAGGAGRRAAAGKAMPETPGHRKGSTACVIYTPLQLARNCFVRSFFGFPKTSSGVPCSAMTPSSIKMT